MDENNELKELVKPIVEYLYENIGKGCSVSIAIEGADIEHGLIKYSIHLDY